MSIQKKCIVCSKEFIAKNDKGIYCSNSCRVKAYRLREKEREEHEVAVDYENSVVYTNIIEHKIKEFENQFKLIYKDLKSLMNHTVNASVSSAQLPALKERIKENSSEISELKNEIRLLTKDLDEQINKNKENIHLIAFHFDQFIDKVNSMNGSKITETLGSVLGNEKFIDTVSMFITNKFKSKEHS